MELVEISQDILPKIDQFLDGFIKETYDRVVKRTPIDTGNAREHYKINKHDIENDVPYIERLEYGWSKQAPAGMLRVTEREAQTITNQILQGLQ